MDLNPIRFLLLAWARECRGTVDLGLPHQSATEAMRCSSGPPPLGELPPDLLLVDQAVAMLPLYHRCVIIAIYCRHGTWSHKAAVLSLSRRQLRRRQEMAELSISALLGIDARPQKLYQADTVQSVPLAC